jgi:transcriptional regulator of acetoin/glycerol metabolism
MMHPKMLRRILTVASEKLPLADRSRGNRALAARLLGISRATLYRRLADLNITPEEK